MGDIATPPTSRRPGIALVRPRLHDNTQENRDLFKRWSKLHMRDTLSIPKNDELGGALRVMRYARTAEGGEEEYLFTIVLDDVRLPGTQAFQKVPQQLDLESTRALDKGEEPVLNQSDARTGTGTMVFSIVAPSVGIFEAIAAGTDRVRPSHRSYQHELAHLQTNADPQSYTLITLTITITEEISTPELRIKGLRDSLVYTLFYSTQQVVHATLYRHSPDAQPSMLPKIPQGQDGRGEWVVCALVGGDRDTSERDPVEEYMGERYGDWVRMTMLQSVDGWKKGLEKEGALKEVDMTVGVWKGDVFMS